MKKIEQKKNYIAYHNLNNLIGINEAIEFFNDFSKESINVLKDFYNNQLTEKVHGFVYREQQLKTFLTIGLGRVTNNLVFQEHPLERRKFVEKKDNDNYHSNGFVDYWAGFKNSNFLIEVKHGWIRYWSKKDEYTLYQRTINKFQDSIYQIDQIEDKVDFKTRKNLFGLGLIVAPLFCRNEDNPNILLDKETKEFIDLEVRKMGGNIWSMWKMEEKYLDTNEYVRSNGKTFTENYPGLLFIGKLKKISKN